MHWFRLHHKLLNDPVVQGLTEHQFKVYINVLCYASTVNRGGCIGTIDETAFALRETISDVSSCFIVFQGVGLIVSSVTDGETFHIPQWGKLQYKSDTSTLRVKKHRESLKRSKTVTVTAPEQIQNRTDTEKDKETRAVALTPAKQAKSSRNKPKKPMPSDFTVTAEMVAWVQEKNYGHINLIEETDKFIDYWKTKGEARADWEAGWRTWIRRADKYQRESTTNGSQRQQVAAAIGGHSQIL